MASPDRDREAQELFQRALDLPENDRAAFLDEHCSEPELRDEVQSLLQAFADADEFLNEPKSTPGEKAGDQIGRYRLLEQIGEGGFGTVWMAEQTEPVRRRVAVKIIKLGMDTKQVVARFEAERQALALMDHPNIAKVLDGGATEHGRPFFVMELVRGLPMTEFCDQANLDTSARLELFQRVCLAVQHAHQKGIIHRDLKPSNVLVTLHDGEPVPKVIDFGVAKATSQELSQRRELLGERDVRTASSLNSLAAIAEALGDREEAERRYRESLATDPGHDIKHVLTRANLAMTLMNLKRWEESEREYDTAIAELEQRMSPNHPTLAMILANKARLFELTDRFGEAEQLLQRVIAMRDATLAKDHPQHGVGRAMLGMVQFARGQDAAADRSIAAAVAILRRAFREPHYFLALTLSNHGHVLRALERNEPAERAFVEAAATYEAAEGRGFEWAEARTGLAAVMIDTDHAAEAVATAREALTVLTEKVPTNWRRHWCAAVLGEALVRVGDVDEGLALLHDAVRQIQPRRAHHRRLKVRAARVLLPLFRQRGQDDDAAAMQQVIDGAGR